MQVLLFEKSYQRVADALADCAHDSEPVLWREDGTITPARLARYGMRLLSNCGPRRACNGGIGA